MQPTTLNSILNQDPRTFASSTPQTSSNAQNVNDSESTSLLNGINASNLNRAPETFIRRSQIPPAPSAQGRGFSIESILNNPPDATPINTNANNVAHSNDVQISRTHQVSLCNGKKGRKISAIAPHLSSFSVKDNKEVKEDPKRYMAFFYQLTPQDFEISEFGEKLRENLQELLLVLVSQGLFKEGLELLEFLLSKSLVYHDFLKSFHQSLVVQGHSIEAGEVANTIEWVRENQHRNIPSKRKKTTRSNNAPSSETDHLSNSNAVERGGNNSNLVSFLSRLSVKDDKEVKEDSKRYMAFFYQLTPQDFEISEFGEKLRENLQDFLLLLISQGLFKEGLELLDSILGKSLMYHDFLKSFHQSLVVHGHSIEAGEVANTIEWVRENQHRNIPSKRKKTTRSNNAPSSETDHLINSNAVERGKTHTTLVSFLSHLSIKDNQEVNEDPDRYIYFFSKLTYRNLTNCDHGNALRENLKEFLLALTSKGLFEKGLQLLKDVFSKGDLCNEFLLSFHKSLVDEGYIFEAFDLIDLMEEVPASQKLLEHVRMFEQIMRETVPNDNQTIYLLNYLSRFKNTPCYEMCWDTLFQHLKKNGRYYDALKLTFAMDSQKALAVRHQLIVMFKESIYRT